MLFELASHRGCEQAVLHSLSLCCLIQRGFFLRQFSRSGEFLLCKSASLAMKPCSQVVAEDAGTLYILLLTRFVL